MGKSVFYDLKKQNGPEIGAQVAGLDGWFAGADLAQGLWPAIGPFRMRMVPYGTYMRSSFYMKMPTWWQCMCWGQSATLVQGNETIYDKKVFFVVRHERFWWTWIQDKKPTCKTKAQAKVVKISFAAKSKKCLLKRERRKDETPLCHMRLNQYIWSRCKQWNHEYVNICLYTILSYLLKEWLESIWHLAASRDCKDLDASTVWMWKKKLGLYFCDALTASLTMVIKMNTCIGWTHHLVKCTWKLAVAETTVIRMKYTQTRHMNQSLNDDQLVWTCLLEKFDMICENSKKRAKKSSSCVLVTLSLRCMQIPGEKNKQDRKTQNVWDVWRDWKTGLGEGWNWGHL